MRRRHPLFALLLALTLVGQGVAFATSSATVQSPLSTAHSGMPCHDQAPVQPSCCDHGASCPDMLVCLTGHALVSSSSVVVLDARAERFAPRDASTSAATRPPTVFRPPIVISA